MVWIFPTSFFLLSSKFSLGKSDLAKILISFEKILLIENSQIAIVVTSEITSHVHAGFQFIFSPSLEKRRTAWPHLAKGESDLWSCQAQRRFTAWMPVLLTTVAAAGGVERLLQDLPTLRHAGFT